MCHREADNNGTSLHLLILKWEFESILNASGEVKLLLSGELMNHFQTEKHHIGDVSYVFKFWSQ